MTSESQYTNRELDNKFQTILEKLDDIHTQTARTNGRVNRLENWRWFITGGLAIIGVVLIPIVIAIITLLPILKH